jgi:hypothetical protein
MIDNKRADSIRYSIGSGNPRGGRRQTSIIFWIHPSFQNRRSKLAGHTTIVTIHQGPAHVPTPLGCREKVGHDSKCHRLRQCDILSHESSSSVSWPLRQNHVFSPEFHRRRSVLRRMSAACDFRPLPPRHPELLTPTHSESNATNSLTSENAHSNC